MPRINYTAGAQRHFEWLASPWYNDVSGTFATVADRAYLRAIWVHTRCAVAKIGIFVVNRINGNIDLGLYDSSFNRVCSSGPIAIAGLINNSYNWLVPTTLPTIDPGIYWVGYASDTTYVAAVSGSQIYRTGAILVDWMDAASLGNWMRIRMDGAYPLPAVFVPVNDNNDAYDMVMLRVTSLS